MYENIQAMLIALGAVCIGLVFTQMGSSSVFISLVGMMLIMGSFVIGTAAIILFIRDLILERGSG